MASSYPTSVDTFSQVTDLVSVVKAADINPVYLAVTQTQTTLGTGITNTYSGVLSYSNASSFSTVKDRLNNFDAAFKYGGISPTSPSGIVNLTLKSASGNTRSLLETYAAGTSTLGFKIDSSGIPYVGASAVLYADSTNNTAYGSILSRLTTVESTADTNSTAINVLQTLNPLLLAGM